MSSGVGAASGSTGTVIIDERSGKSRSDARPAGIGTSSMVLLDVVAAGAVVVPGGIVVVAPSVVVGATVVVGAVVEEVVPLVATAVAGWVRGMKMSAAMKATRTHAPSTRATAALVIDSSTAIAPPDYSPEATIVRRSSAGFQRFG